MRKLLVALGGLFLCLAANAQNTAVGSLTAQGTDCTTAGACITLQFEGNDVGSASIQLSGTFTATVQFEASSDKGTTWVAISGTPLNSSATATSATTANTWKFNVASITNIRARCSAWTSAPTVVIRSSRAVANATGGTSLPALSDNGTNVVSAEAVLEGFGAVGTPSYSFTGNTNTGMWSASANGLFFSVAGTRTYFMGASAYGMSSSTIAGWSSTSDGAAGNDTFYRRRSAANFALGTSDVNGTPVDQTISVQNAITGTDLPGGHTVIDAPLGTGAGAGSSTKINRAQILATGTTAQTSANAFVVCETKILSNTSATTTAIATIALASNSGGGVSVFHSLTATDATNFDSETQSYNVSFVNKAGVITVGTPAITTSTAANNSGSATIGATVTGASPTISLKVTPVYGTIVPTTVTLYTTIINHGAGAVTCN